jgi:uncharacterized protein YutE (UPF0331/DUF86 family)
MREKIAEKLAELKHYADFLESYQDRSEDQIEDDYTLRGAVERYLQIAIECTLDIGEMIIAYEGLRKAGTYREVMLRLGDAGILEKGFASRFSLAAGFRNILVHHYTTVDVKETYKHLQGDLDDFRDFAAAIAKYLEKKK